MIDKQSRDERRRAQRAGVEALEASGALDDLYARIDAGEVRFDGATRAQIERDLKGHPALESPKRIYPEYFISKLETIGGLSWDGAWRTTEAGARILESLA